MKNLVLFNILFFLVFNFASCKKEQNIRKMFIYTGKAEHKYTGMPIPGLEMQFARVKGSFLGMSSSEVLSKTSSDSNGEFTFSIEEGSDHKSYEISSLLPVNVDTLSLTSKFIPGTITVDFGRPHNPETIQLEPTGLVIFSVPDKTWDSIPGDTVILVSPYRTVKFIRGQYNSDQYMIADPSQFTAFSWFYKSNGILGDTITRIIYARNTLIHGTGAPYKLYFP